MKKVKIAVLLLIVALIVSGSVVAAAISQNIMSKVNNDSISAKNYLKLIAEGGIKSEEEAAEYMQKLDDDELMLFFAEVSDELMESDDTGMMIILNKVIFERICPKLSESDVIGIITNEELNCLFRVSILQWYEYYSEINGVSNDRLYETMKDILRTSNSKDSGYDDVVLMHFVVSLETKNKNTDDVLEVVLKSDFAMARVQALKFIKDRELSYGYAKDILDNYQSYTKSEIDIAVQAAADYIKRSKADTTKKENAEKTFFTFIHEYLESGNADNIPAVIFALSDLGNDAALAVLEENYERFKEDNKSLYKWVTDNNTSLINSYLSGGDEAKIMRGLFWVEFSPNLHFSRNIDALRDSGSQYISKKADELSEQIREFASFSKSILSDNNN